MDIKIEDYLSEDEIKEIVIEEVKRHVRACVGETSVSSDVGRIFIGKLSKQLAKDGVQEIIPNFKELINEQIASEIKKIDLASMFFASYGWKSEGNKALAEAIANNKGLLDAKIKEIFSTVIK